MAPTSDERRTLAMVVPAYNEADHIAATIAALPDMVDRIIVVDDASTDRTANVAHTLGDPRVIVIEHERNAGVGGAMRTGYREALAQGYEFIGKIDADGQMRADELERLVEPLLLGIADYAKGNRFYLRGAAADMPAERSLGNTVLSFMTKLASGYWHVFDSQCGYTVVRSAFLELIDLDTLPDDYFFENSMLIKLNALNARVVDVPITTLYGREVSGVSILRVATTFPARLMLGGTARFWRKHLVTDFGATGVLTLSGLTLLAFGAAFGGYHWWLSMTTEHIATTGTVMLAVLPLIVGIQLLLQAFSMSVQASPGAKQTARYVRDLISERRL